VKQGHEVACICEGSHFPQEFLDFNIQVHYFEFPKKNSPLEFIFAVQRMRKLIRTGNYHCVNSHNRNASIIARIAAWFEKVPVNLYTAHGFYFHDDQSPLSKEITVWLEIILARLTDFTLSQSQEDVEFTIKRGFIKADKIKYIGNGIDTTRFMPNNCREKLEQELGFSTNRFRICSVGRLVKGKGFFDLLDGFVKFHDVVENSELLIIGGNIAQDISPFQQEFLNKVESLGLQKNVIVTGITDQVENYLATCDVFVLPSYREGLPRSLLEAMSMGIPSLATNIRGCREAISDGENGFLFEPKDIEGIFKLILNLYHCPDICLKFSKASRETVVDKYDESKYIQVQVQVITQLLNKCNEV
jgi:glycosyltransferase involved in cell wall biosynthesis